MQFLTNIILLSLNKETCTIIFLFHKCSVWVPFVTHRSSSLILLSVSRSVDWMDSRIQILRSVMSQIHGMLHPTITRDITDLDSNLWSHSVSWLGHTEWNEGWASVLLGCHLCYKWCSHWKCMKLKNNFLSFFIQWQQHYIYRSISVLAKKF